MIIQYIRRYRSIDVYKNKPFITRFKIFTFYLFNPNFKVKGIGFDIFRKYRVQYCITWAYICVGIGFN